MITKLPHQELDLGLGEQDLHEDQLIVVVVAGTGVAVLDGDVVAREHAGRAGSGHRDRGPTVVDRLDGPRALVAASDCTRRSVDGTRDTLAR